jgi:sensor histidine kinase regulating citrate/malate metabolism
MRLAIRLNLLLIAGVAAVAMGFAYYQVRSERRGLERDLQRQALDLAESQAKAVEPLLAAHSYRSLQAMVDRSTGRERLAGIVVSDAKGEPVAITSGLIARLNGKPPDILHADGQDETR